MIFAKYEHVWVKHRGQGVSGHFNYLVPKWVSIPELPENTENEAPELPEIIENDAKSEESDSSSDSLDFIQLNPKKKRKASSSWEVSNAKRRAGRPKGTTKAVMRERLKAEQALAANRLQRMSSFQLQKETCGKGTHPSKFREVMQEYKQPRRGNYLPADGTVTYKYSTKVWVQEDDSESDSEGSNVLTIQH